MFIIFSYLELELMCVWLFVGAAWDNGVCSLCMVLCVFRMKAAVKLCDNNLGEQRPRYFGFATC